MDPYEHEMAAINTLSRNGDVTQAVDRIFDQSTGKLKAIFRKDANHSWYVLGDLYTRLGFFEEAIKAFQKSLRSWPEDWQAMWALGNCYDEVNKAWLAERYFRRALEIEKRHPALLYNLGNALFSQGKYADAIKCYKSVLKTENDTKELAQKNMDVARNSLNAGKRAKRTKSEVKNASRKHVSF